MKAILIKKDYYNIIILILLTGIKVNNKKDIQLN